MGTLDRTGPQVDHRQLKELAVPGENFAALPGLEDQVVRFIVALALLNGADSVAQVDVHRRAQRHSRDQPSAADAIQHRVFFGHPDGRIGGRQRRAHLHDGRIHPIGRARQHRAHHVGRGHETVGVLMVLVDANPVHPAFGGVDQFVQGPVVVLTHLLRIGQLPERRIDPNRVVTLFEVRGQLAVRHQMEHGNLHADLLRGWGQRLVDTRRQAWVTLPTRHSDMN